MVSGAEPGGRRVEPPRGGGEEEWTGASRLQGTPGTERKTPANKWRVEPRPGAPTVPGTEVALGTEHCRHCADRESRRVQKELREQAAASRRASHPHEPRPLHGHRPPVPLPGVSGWITFPRSPRPTNDRARM